MRRRTVERPRRSLRSTIATVGLLAVAMVGQAACSNGGTPGPGPSEGSAAASGGVGELTMWVRAANEGKSRELAAAYEEATGIRVAVTAFPDDQYVTRLATAASTGDLPDVLATDSAYMPRFLEPNIFADLTDRVAALPFADELFEPLMDVSTRDGRVYALPRDPGNSMVLWNKDLFREAGLDPDAAPTTWAEMLESARAVDALGGDVSGFYFPGNCGVCNVFPWLPLVWASGGDLFDAEGRPTFDDPEVVAALELYRTIVQEGLVPPSAQTDTGSDWMTAFTAGKVGILPLGSFGIGTIREANPEMDMGIAPLPGREGGSASFVGGDVIGIPLASAHPDEAWEFIAWTLSDEVQIDVVAASHELVARTDLVENEHSEADPLVRIANDALAVSRTPQSVFYQQLVVDANGPFSTLFYDVTYGGADAAEAAAAAQRAALNVVGAGE